MPSSKAARPSRAAVRGSLFGSGDCRRAPLWRGDLRQYRLGRSSRLHRYWASGQPPQSNRGDRQIARSASGGERRFCKSLRTKAKVARSAHSAGSRATARVVHLDDVTTLGTPYPPQGIPSGPFEKTPGPLRRRGTRYVFVSSLPSPSATLAAPDEGAQTVPTEKAMTEKGKRRIRREILPPYEMSLVQTAFGMSAQHTTSEPLRSALVKIAKKLTNIDRMIVEEDLD